MFVIEFSVNLKDVFGKIDYMFFVIFTISFGKRNSKFKFVSFMKVYYL